MEVTLGHKHKDLLFFGSFPFQALYVENPAKFARDSKPDESNQIIALHAAGTLSAVRSTARLGKVLKRKRKHLCLHFAMSEATSSNRATEEASLPMLVGKLMNCAKYIYGLFHLSLVGVMVPGVISSFSHFLIYSDAQT